MADDPDDRWDFYLARVDDAPGSIFLNLRYADEKPALDTLYWVAVKMRDPADHGMGGAAEAEELYPMDDHFVATARAAGFLHVGRLRNHGVWQLTFYGKPDRKEQFGGLVREHGFGGRQLAFDSQPDRDWSYYDDFLYPSAERVQWMQDRELVSVLEGHGDRLVTPRRVDHWAYFASAAQRDAYVGAARTAGFDLEDASHSEETTQPFGAQLFRTDPVELEHIHSVVMTLVDLAEEHGGEYDGWETSVEKV
jgi:hypothetical protein